MGMESWSGKSISDFGYSTEMLGKLARLGLVFDSIETDFADGQAGTRAQFRFVADSPMGRANQMCATDLEMLGICIDDARELTYDDFQSKYGTLGPYS